MTRGPSDHSQETSVFSWAPAFGVVPTHVLADTDEQWHALLANPPVGPKSGPCIRGVTYRAGATSAGQADVERVHAALFDLDREGDVPTYAALAQALEGHRFVAWTTWSSFATHAEAGVKTACRTHGEPFCSVCRVGPRLRLYVPYARPVTPAEHAYVWHAIHAMLENISDVSQANVDRLGFLPGLRPSEPDFARANYSYYIHQGPRLDPYTRFGNGESFPPELIEAFRPNQYHLATEIPEPDRRDWYSDEEAVDRARAYFRNVGPGITPGGRHAELFKIACKLWWDFWLPRQSVAQILHEINNRFPQPKTSQEVDREVLAAFARTRGPSAVQQLDGQGNVVEPGAMRKRPGMLTPEDILAEIARGKRSHDVLKKETAAALTTLLPSNHGYKPIGNLETRDRNVRLCARLLGEAFPDHDPNSILSYFAGPVNAAAMQEPWDVTPARILGAIVAAQDEVKKLREKRRDEERNLRALRIEQATGGARSTPYQIEDMYKFMDEIGVESLDVLEHRLIIHSGGANYIYVNGNYKAPVSDTLLPIAAETDLSPYANVVLHKATKEGALVLMSRDEILSRYGTVARDVVVDLTAQRSYYDRANDTFVEASCPLRPIKPEFVPAVQSWLETFNDPIVFHWLSYVADLNTPLPALYLHGPAGVGKNLFAYGVARLFPKTAPTALAEAFGNFNADISKNPILFADEVLPDALLTKTGSYKYRALVTEKERALRRKFLGNACMRGYLRVIVGANNLNSLPRGDMYMTDGDIEATAARTIVVNVPETARAYLESLNGGDQRFVDDDLIAKHALWLRDNRPQARHQGRFPVVRSDTLLTRQESFKGARDMVLRWVHSMLAKDTDGSFVPVVVYGDKRYFALNATLMTSEWKLAFGFDAQPPNAVDVQSAVKSLQNGVQTSVRLRTEGRGRQRYRLVPVSTFAAWALANDVDENTVDEHLARVPPRVLTPEDFQ